ncbi:MAG: C-GCAxxG-C-C family protein [Promethearchaeota archaeon]
MEQKDKKSNINERFDEKIKELEEILPKINPAEGGCAEITLTAILDILGFQNGIFSNLMIPLSAGLGGYKSKDGWAGPCGVVCGSCSAIGVIVGGREKMPSKLVPVAYIKGAQFPTSFEKEFGSVSCPDLCGYDLGNQDDFMEYFKNNVWEKTCHKFITWAVDTVRDITQEELVNNW